VKLPRDLSGADLARALSRYGYQITRQSGSHMRLSSSYKGTQHHVTIPAHSPLKIGTLSQNWPRNYLPSARCLLPPRLPAS
jgi:predicted RNA binding protein YcfA (HicA-like mRNA interferase family)